MAFKFNPFEAAEEAAKTLQKAANTAGKTIGEGAVEAGKRAAEFAEAAGKVVAENAAIAAEAAQEAKRNYELAHYNPLFPEDYLNPEFDRPKLVVVVDEDSRKGIEVCEGAIGWMDTNSVPEIMYLYEKAVANSGLSFYPRAICDTAYLQDPFDSELYVVLNSYLELNKKDQFTELKYIARELGATKCVLESYESVKVTTSENNEVNAAVKPIGKASASRKSNENSAVSFKAVFEEKFEGGEARQPKLKWFAHDKEILALIESRCSQDNANTHTEYSADITSSATRYMSNSYAAKIDSSLKTTKINLGFSLKKEFEQEHNKRLIFKVWF